MPCYIRMKRTFLQGLLWLYLLGFGFMALSLEPGFLDFDNLPDTNFSCVGKVIGGYYADLETNCQMFHVCTIGQLEEPMDIRFLCLNGTVFDQETRVCERIDEVDCSKSEQFYSLNLELYGNTQPATLEESPETEQPLIIKSTTTTTTTTTPAPKTSRTPFYTTATTPRATTASPQVISTHHFPVVNSPDIRFNPEEINISLHPGAPPDIRTNTAFQSHGYSDNNKKVVVTHSGHGDATKIRVTTHAPVFEGDKVLQSGQGLIDRPQVKQQPLPVTVRGYERGGDVVNRPTPSDINFGFTFHQTEANDDYHTEEPLQFRFHPNFAPNSQFPGNHPHQNSHALQYQATTTPRITNSIKQKPPTTTRNYYLQQSLTPPAPNQQHHYHKRTEKTQPQRGQLPLPLLPTLPPLTFSSPAPFALQRHIETKRYTKDHPIPPPRIIISASASVSDASGRRLNYSLGTIGAAEILEEPPSSYDEYKEDDVGLDPFYHDVPKIKRSRTKRDADGETDASKREDEVDRVLDFLWSWHKDSENSGVELVTVPSTSTTNKIRRRRETDAIVNPSDIIKSEEEAVDVLKFLLEWYRNKEKTENTTQPTVISSTDAQELVAMSSDKIESTKESTITEKADEDDFVDFGSSELFDKNSRYSIIGNHDINVEESMTNENVQPGTAPNDGTPVSKKTVSVIIEQNKKVDTTKYDVSKDIFDYVDDNFEPITFNETYGDDNENFSKDFQYPEKHMDEKPISKDYVDDNVEPIYYRDRVPSKGKESSRESDDIEKNRILEEPKVTDASGLEAHNNSNEVSLENSNYEIKELNDALLEPVGEEEESAKNETEIRNEVSEGINMEIKELNDALSPFNVDEIGDALSEEIADTNANNISTNLNETTQKIEDAKETTIKTVPDDNITSRIDKESKEINEALLSISGENNNTETNNINKEDGDNKEFNDDLLVITPRPSITTTTSPIEASSTVSSTTRPRNGRRRGRTRFNNNNNTKIKEPEYKNVVIEKITEKAHTAKDDFNYLRTLYKVLTTTPMYNISDEANPYVKLRKTTNSHHENSNFQNIDLANSNNETPNVPLLTTERTTTSTTSSRRGVRRRGKARETTQRSRTRKRPNYDTSLPKDVPSTVTTSLSDKRTTASVPSVTPHFQTTTPLPTIADGLDRDTTFLNELTYNYKRLFDVLKNPVPVDTQPTVTLEDYGTFMTSFATSTEPMNEAPKEEATTESEESKSTTTQNLTTYITTELPLSIAPKITINSRQKLDRGGRYNNFNPLPSTIPNPTRNDQVFTATARSSSGFIAPIPTTLSDLYKEVNIEASNAAKVLLQTIKYDTTTTPNINTDEVSKVEEPTTEAVTVISSTEGNTETVTDSVSTTQLTTEYPTDKEEITTIVDTLTTQSTPKDDKQRNTVKQLEKRPAGIFIEEVTRWDHFSTVSSREINSNFDTTTGGKKELTQDVATFPSTISDSTTELPSTVLDITSTEKTLELPAPPVRRKESRNRHRASTTLGVTTSTESYKKSEGTKRTRGRMNYLKSVGLNSATSTTTSATSTAENTEAIKDQVLVTTISSTVELPSIIDVSTSTENYKTEETVVPTKLTTEKMEEFIKEVEATTKSVVVGTETPLIKPKTNGTGEMEDLKELVKEIQDMTKSKIGTATIELMADQKEVTSTTTVRVPTTESTTFISTTNQVEEQTTQRGEFILSQAEPTIQIERFEPRENAVTVEVKPASKPEETTTEFVENTTEGIPTENAVTTEEIVTNTFAVETTTSEEPTTTAELPERRRGGARRRGTRLPSKRISTPQRTTSRHRFSTDSFTRRPEGRKQTIEEEIIDIVKNSYETTTEPVTPARRRHRKRKRIDVRSTEAPLQKSASPTGAEMSRQSLHTTPLSKAGAKRQYIFNCFGKDMDKFYPDPRDCRLFHYCTQGYTKNQLLDMKFVCDQNTYYDDEKLICTKVKPERCL